MDQKPLFRADHVGSLLRPEIIKENRKKFFEDKIISSEELKLIEDTEIKKIVKLQEELGFKVVTDGEFRRSFWHYDFLEGLDGFELEERESGVQFSGAKLRPFFPVIKNKIDFPSDHPMLEHFKFVAKNSSVLPKIAIPGPSCCHFRTTPNDIYPKEYEDNEKLFFDIAQTYKKAVQEFYDIGCRYLQMDDIFFAYLCDPNHRTTRMKFGEDPDELIEKYAWMLNEAIKDRPKDMTVGMHLCRGNFKSNFAAQGAYDPTVDAVFNKIDLDVYFMEYDDERSGGLEPLKYLPKGNKRVMPGFITTKQGKLETLDFLKKKFEEASKYISIDQLGIAPQCGFSSTEEGNIISLEDQKRKLELVIEASNKIWGE
ncbi:MAG: 5-methyltetrahydropteroyltriglutamate--homocysteine S-methyltransferase [Candidatus Puniceispirillales bacterium]|jgi:5-methyltetrahydropteroyltriglutamate--homocysteine methyltransferase|tara:strand:+ start:3540 stop:4649 length:1110 start_codon:yes stop_codon:yes gene_type:complete